jgi:hypothetical protein
MPSAKRSRPKCRDTLKANPAQTEQRRSQSTKPTGTQAVQISQVLHNRRPTEITAEFLFIYYVRNADCEEAEGKQGEGTRMIIGYARVSTDGQTLEGQDAALKTAGASRVFAEKISGAAIERKARSKAIAAPQAEDVLLVTRLDRLARSTRDLLNVLATVSARGAACRSWLMRGQTPQRPTAGSY